MKQKIDNRQALRVFQKVIDHGVKVDDEYQMHGIYASTDFDGYTIFLRNHNVHLTMGFHSTLTVEYDNSEDLRLFMCLLRDIDSMNLSLFNEENRSNVA